MKKVKLLLVFVFGFLVSKSQLFQQGFSVNEGTILNAAGTVTAGNYFSNSPSNGQFNRLEAQSGHTVVSDGSTLSWARSSNAGVMYRTTNLSGTAATSWIVSFDYNLVTASGSGSTALTMYAGQSFPTSGNGAPAGSNVHSQIIINISSSSGGTWGINGTNNSISNGTSVKVTWVINNSGSSISYVAPDGSIESVANDTYDVWLGATKDKNDVAASTAAASLNNFGIRYSGSNSTSKFDNIFINPIPPLGTPATVTTTSPVSNLGTNSATISGNITSIGSSPVTTRGFAIGTSVNPVVDANAISEASAGFSTGNYSINASGLNAGTTYHTRAFATNGSGISYGADVAFITISGPPSVTTGTLGTVTTNSTSISNNNVTADGGAVVTGRGVVYGTSSNPVNGDAGVVAVTSGSGTGTFNSSLTGLASGTTYYVRAYAINTNGIAYATNELSFTTKANYRSKIAGGLWNDPGTWEVFNGTTWIDAASTPTNADGTIEIITGSIVTVSADVIADQMTIDAGGQLTIAAGQTFTVANGSGTDLIIDGRLKASGTVNTAGTVAVNATGVYEHNYNGDMADGITWNAGSTCEITGITSGYAENGTLVNLSGSLQNLTWNCPSQGNFYVALGNNSISIAGKLKVVSTGSGILLLPAGSQTTLQAGSFEQLSGTVFINRNGGGNRTFQVNGDATISGNSVLHIKTFGSSSEGRFIIKGNLAMDPTTTLTNSITSGSATLEFSGSSAQTASFGTIDGSGDIDLILNNSNGLTLGTDCALTGNITLSNGKIHTGANTISIPSDATTSSFSSSRYINGKFGKGIGSGTTSKTFEIGDATNYTPVTISFSGTTNGSGSLVASTTATDHPDLSNSGINASKSVNRYFSVENNGVSGFSSFNITMNYAAADVDAGATAASFKVRKYSTANIPSWIAPASVSVGSNSITATGFNSFSDFAIGEVAIPTTTSIMNVTATYGDGVVTLTAGIIPPDATGLIHFFVDCLEVGTGMNAGGTATFDLDPSALTVGNHVIRAEYYTDGTYESSVSENGELTIHPKQLTVTIAANDKEYDGSMNAVVSVGSVSGIIGSEDVSVVASNGQFIDKNVGNGKEVSASLALAGADKDNYTIDLSAITTANISAKAVTISIAADNKPYDGNTSATVTAVDPVAGVVAGDDVIASASNGQFASADAGNGIAVSADVAAAGDDAGNYTFNNTASTTADITKADATIVVNGYTGMYDGNEHGASLVSAVGVNNEDLAASVDLGLKYKNVGVENAGWTFSNKNYNAQADAVEIEITPAELIVTVNNASKLCGQADPVFTGMITGAVGLEVFTATYTAVGTAIAAAINENTDNYDVVIYEGLLSITGVSIDASASSNPVKLGDIAKLSATVSPVAANVKVSFYLNDVLQCAVMTNASGIATKDITGLAVGVYKVKAIVGDDCAESIAYLPVYDPSGGFVTGGGWILSPAGAYVADAALTGKANFGFNAKYKKGSNAVDGNTEFQFQAGNLNFKSTENTAGTLVIAGAKANFKGKGSINGVAGYSFMVSGIDGDINGGGGTDKFRIKIWNTASSELVYDNNLGFDENSVPTTCLGGGSIVIHEVKAGGKTSQKVDPDLLVTSLDARVFNNPAAGASTFRLKVLSPDADQKISLRIVDMSGKSLDQMQGLSAGQTVEFGAMYKTGMYVAEIVQNGQRKLVKLVKQ